MKKSLEEILQNQAIMADSDSQKIEDLEIFEDISDDYYKQSVQFLEHKIRQDEKLLNGLAKSKNFQTFGDNVLSMQLVEFLTMAQMKKQELETLKKWQLRRDRMMKIVQKSNPIKSYLIKIYKEAVYNEKIQEGSNCLAYKLFRQHFSNLILSPLVRCKECGFKRDGDSYSYCQLHYDQKVKKIDITVQERIDAIPFPAILVHQSNNELHLKYCCPFGCENPHQTILIHINDQFKSSQEIQDMTKHLIDHLIADHPNMDIMGYNPTYLKELQELYSQSYQELELSESLGLQNKIGAWFQSQDYY